MRITDLRMLAIGISLIFVTACGDDGPGTSNPPDTFEDADATDSETESDLSPDTDAEDTDMTDADAEDPDGDGTDSGDLDGDATDIGDGTEEVVDPVDPVVIAITDGPEALVSDTTATFTFDCSEDGCEFECKLDAGLFKSCENPAVFADLSDGEHTLEARGRLDDGEWSETVNRTWTVDSQALLIMIDSRPSPYVSTRDVTVEFRCSKDTCTAECDFNDEGYETCTSPLEYTQLGQGSYTLKIRGSDEAGNDSPVREIAWEVDFQPTYVENLTGPPEFTNETTATIEFGCSNAPCVFDCSLNDAGYSPCESGVEYRNLPDGLAEVAVKATGRNGTISEPESYSFTVDTANPAARILSQPASLTNSSSATLEYDCSEAGCTTECKLNTDPFAACDSPSNLSNLDDGNQTFTVRATDRAGNISDEVSATWTVDTQAPSLTNLQGPPSLTNDRGAWPTFGCDDTDCTVLCRLDGAAATECTSGAAPAGLADGGHSVELWAVDAAGNESSHETVTWTLDTTGPVISITSGPPSRTNVEAVTIVYTCADANGCAVGCELVSDDPSRDGEFENCPSPLVRNAVTEGSHTVTFTGTDNAGNVGEPATYTWTLDSVPPELTNLLGPPAFTNDSSAWPTFGCDDSDCTVMCALDNGAAVACTSGVAPQQLADGSHEVEVYAVDALGNESSTQSVSWTVDTEKPTVIVSGQPPALANSDSAIIEFGCDETGCDFECARPGSGSFQSCTSPLNLSGLSEGENNAQIVAIDRAGNHSATKSVVWTVDTIAPVVSGEVPDGVFTGEEFEVSIDASDAVFCEFREQNEAWQEIPNCGTSTAELSFAFSGSTTTNDQTISFRATDAAGNLSPARVYDIEVRSIAWEKIAAGPVHTCGILEYEGSLFCWGRNLSQQISSENEEAYFAPALVGDGYTDIALGLNHTCGLKGTDLECWGSEALGVQVPGGDRPGQHYYIPGSWQSITAGWGFTCGVRTNGSLYCWGEEEYGQLGNGSTTTPQILPDFISSGPWESVTAGDRHVCATRTNGDLYCWGDNRYYGQVGNGSSGPDSFVESPTKIGSGYKSVGLGQKHSCAVLNSGRTHCWGANLSSQYGSNNAASDTPIIVSFAIRASVASGGNHTCGISFQGLSCWGRNDSFQTGYSGSTSDVETPYELNLGVAGTADSRRWAQVVAGFAHTCALTTDGYVNCWGDNSAGQIARPKTTNFAWFPDINGPYVVPTTQ